MKQRWLVAIIGLPLLLAVLLFCPPWATAILVCAIAAVAAYELLHVAGKNVPNWVYAVVCVCAAQQAMTVYRLRRFLDTELAFPYLEESRTAELFLFPFLLVVLLFLIAILTYGKPGAVPFATVAVGVVGGVVFPMMYSCILLLRMQGDFGRLYVLAPFFIAFAGDSLAMYCGKWFGKKKLTPVSPNKTWAGFWGGALGSTLGMLLLGVLGARWLGYAPNYLYLALVGVAGNLLGQLGDLSTSLVKREAGVKDYSRLFLTHGGVLDRFDSTLFIAPVVYFFVSIGII
ncbi:MAG: phosphatidate cytidylyltransferase [Oscillospiraceae bacterium]|nr:phosphatidate cytidylyltransferase [Oscillospiraceae bacterium]